MIHASYSTFFLCNPADILPNWIVCTARQVCKMYISLCRIQGEYARSANNLPLVNWKCTLFGELLMKPAEVPLEEK